MSQDRLIKFQCEECKRINYYSSKNKNKLKKIRAEEILSLVQKHTLHKELKK